MKRYYWNRTGMSDVPLRAPRARGAYYSAADVDRLRAKAREKLAEFIASEMHNDDSAPCMSCYFQADAYLNVIFGEDKHE